MSKTKNILRQILPYSVLIVMILVFGFTTEDFFTWKNINALLHDTALIGIVATGITFVMLGGGVDLSVGSIVNLALIVEARLIGSAGMPAIPAILIGLLVGAAAGFFNAFIIDKLHLMEFIATLSTQMVLRGVVYLCGEKDRFGNLVTSGVKNNVLKAIKSDAFGSGIYWVTIAWILLVIISQIVLKKTKFGVYTYARGSNLLSSQLSGINTTKMRYAHYTIAGLFSGIAGTFTLAWMGAATFTAGTNHPFECISMFVVGTTVFCGGIGNAVGTAAGSLFMKLVTNGLLKYGLPTEYQFIAQGVLILGLGGYAAISQAVIAHRRHKAAFEADKKAALEGGQS